MEVQKPDKNGMWNERRRERRGESWSQTHPQIPYEHQTTFCKASLSGGGLVELVRRENKEEGGGIEEKKRAHFVGWHSTMLDREMPTHLRITLHPEKQTAALPPDKGTSGASNPMTTINIETCQIPDAF